MRQDVKEAWVVALLDPEARQMTKCLGRLLPGEIPTECCMGVLARVLNDKFPDLVEKAGYRINLPGRDGYYNIVTIGGIEGYETVIPYGLCRAIGLGTDMQSHLSRLNDQEGWSLGAIAAEVGEKA